MPDKISIDTTPTECSAMINHKKCDGSEMKVSGNKYVYDRKPENYGYWLRTITLEVINCASKLHLRQLVEDANFPTPIGTGFRDSR